MPPHSQTTQTRRSVVQLLCEQRYSSMRRPQFGQFCSGSMDHIFFDFGGKSKPTFIERYFAEGKTAVRLREFVRVW
jgi:hypothetical protein